MVYTNFWELDFYPFANDNRPETFVPTHAASLAVARLRYALGTGMGASALFGEPGSGKSRAARIIEREFAGARWLTAYFPNPSGTPRDILAALNADAAAAVPSGSFGMIELQTFLAERARCNQPALLVVDDVQAARGTDFLETLRTLLNIENDGVKALSILLVGQPGMERKLAAASGFDGQLMMRAVLDPMTDEETRLYILARLKAAGSRQGIFTKQSAELVVKFSKGLPRQVNRLCELSLVIAYGLEEKRVTPEIVEMAAADLDVLPAGEAAFFHWPHPASPETAPPEEPADEDDVLAALTAEAT
ncbi:MAG: AAA family ATPase [Planctomycetota bacterium]|jgi:type II secretory pathway predicted ATPase ExeA|nr:AAA family ATPase [Planctomycetota bacterium]